ncbi:uncharacterized F-box/LRR-repeat protein C02F5.7 [Diachasma alloeum]|uniref:uncharacterized F-box/LRR-repeat protein C02F5.7 n=1 Tax=Diachasma alloeum TaxID=454923 RepID=UPI000738483A|nr:uncharacterized F-box/LRR-repeat protein C02F5.7 [Diachasma alloeum]
MTSIINMEGLLIDPQIDDFASPSSITIHDLPDDCLIRIFSYLEILQKLEAEKVCRRWYKISKRGWRDVKTLCLKDKYPDCNIRQATKLLRRSGRLLTSLRIPANYERSVYLRVLQKYCPQIRKLELVFDYWAFRPVLECHAKSLAALFSTLEKLNWLVMEQINGEVGNKQLRALPGGLQSLEMAGSLGYSINVLFSADLSKFQNLQLLSLEYFIIQEVSFRSLEQLKHLKELNLSFSYVPEASIKKIQNFEKLERLELRQRKIEGLDPKIIRDHHICDIVEGCKKLKVLKLDGLERLTDHSFRAISTLRHLETLHMERMPKVTNRAIVSLHQVQNLNCSHCSGIDNQGLKQLIESSQNLVDLKVQGTADMRTFLHDVSEAVKNRKSVLTIDVGDKEKPLVRPENFPISVVLI